MWHETEIRVRYAETDKMGIVHHSNYFVWFELGRSEFCRSRGFSYRDMEDKDNALLVVAESYCRYKSPAHYEDILYIRTQVARIRSRSIVFVYEIYRPADNAVIAEGETMHIVVNREKKIISLPKQYEAMLISGSGEQDAFPAGHPPS
ncbi:MAG: acyl-CoA thioesterase [Acidobacteriota bacterium]|nr:MAG: acyl-CoA thioesterase [Acidobacteriota bacterium]